MREEQSGNNSGRPTNIRDILPPQNIYTDDLQQQIQNEGFEFHDASFSFNLPDLYADDVNHFYNAFPQMDEFGDMPDVATPTPSTTQYFPTLVPEVKSEVTSTSSPLPNNEESLDLTRFHNQTTSVPSPTIFLNTPPAPVEGFDPWEGDYKFRVHIPPGPSREVRPRAKPKFIFSEVTNKLYVAKNVAFPVCITMDYYPENATLVMCPIYTNDSSKMSAVNRCPNCTWADPNDASKDHIIQFEGTGHTYFKVRNRYMVSVPLGAPAPGENSVNVFLKCACNTSCVGGPNRNLFSILFTLKVCDRVLGRQVIDLKCCEGPNRDRKHEEKSVRKQQAAAETAQNTAQEGNGSLGQLRPVGPDGQNSNRGKKDKGTEQKIRMVVSSYEEYEYLKVPKTFTKQVKRYINTLHLNRELKRQKLDIKKYYPSEESDE